MTLLSVEGLRKEYARGWPRRVTFALEADFRIEQPAIVGMMGPNGSGKTTLFELITGSNLPSSGRVLCCGKNIHRVRYDERDRLAIHYHQAYQVRRFARTLPGFMLERAGSDYPVIHLFDEPQFNTQDGYIGFMLDFFRRLRAEGKLVFVCLHPTARYHLEILKEIAESFLLVHGGSATAKASFADLVADERARAYLGREMTAAAEALA
jgi:ABC-type Na+ transport system ATPase subunit NatA